MHMKEPMDKKTLLINILTTVGIFIIATLLAVAFFDYIRKKKNRGSMYLDDRIVVCRY